MQGLGFFVGVWNFSRGFGFFFCRGSGFGGLIGRGLRVPSLGFGDG